MNTNTNFFIISRSVLLRNRNISNTVLEKIKTHILCSVTFLERHAVLWDNIENYNRAGQATDDKITRRMRIACSVPEAKHTHIQCV
jgi:hypothetical protein